MGWRSWGGPLIAWFVLIMYWVLVCAGGLGLLALVGYLLGWLRFN